MLPPVRAALLADATVVSLLGSGSINGGSNLGGVWRHGEAPQGAEPPYITWFCTIAPENELSDVPGMDRCTVQLDAWHTTDEGVVALATAARNAIERLAHCTAVPVNGRDATTRWYRIGMQFDWFLPRT